MKVPDCVIRVKDLQLIEFMDYVQAILNQGLYEMRITTVVPTWQANNGESAIYFSGDVRRLYFYVNGVWATLGINSLGTLTLFDQDGDTGITPEATANEDIIRFYTAGFYKFGMSTYGFFTSPGTPVVFDGPAGGTQWVYDTSTGYLTGYVEGIKRIEM